MKQNGYELLKLMGELDSELIQEAAVPLTPAEMTIDGDRRGPVETGRKSRLMRRVLMMAAAVGLLGCLVIGMLAVLKLERGENTDPGYDASVREPIYSGDDLQAFIDYWLESHGGQGSDFLVVPVLRSEAYVFDGVTENEYKYLYYFRPAECEGDYKGTIRIYLNKENGATFEGVVDRFDLTVHDGRAYYERPNACSWFIDCQGVLLHIDLPLFAGADRFSAVTDLFSFVVYTADGESYTVID